MPAKRSWISERDRHYQGKFLSMFRVEICDSRHQLDYATEINEWFHIMIDGRKPMIMFDPNNFHIIIEFEHKRDAVAFCVLFGRIRQLRIKKFYEFSFEDRTTFRE